MNTEESVITTTDTRVTITEMIGGWELSLTAPEGVEQFGIASVDLEVTEIRNGNAAMRTITLKGYV